MIEQLRENLEQVRSGQVPSWISDEQMEHLVTGKKHPKLSGCQMRQLTKVWFNDDCKGTPGKALGMILGLPISTDDRIGLRVFEVENIGTIHEDIWIGTMALYHMQWRKKGGS